MLRPGAEVWCGDEKMTLVDLKGLKEAVLQKSDGQQVTRLISALKYNRSTSRRPRGDLAAIDSLKWREAGDIAKHMGVLSAIPDAERTVEDVDKVAEFFGKSRSTIYRWLDNYRSNGNISALLRKQRDDAGTSRLDERVEEVITRNINKSYLTENRRSIASVAEDIKKECVEFRRNLTHLAQ